MGRFGYSATGVKTKKDVVMCIFLAELEGLHFARPHFPGESAGAFASMSLGLCEVLQQVSGSTNVKPHRCFITFWVKRSWQAGVRGTFGHLDGLLSGVWVGGGSLFSVLRLFVSVVG